MSLSAEQRELSKLTEGWRKAHSKPAWTPECKNGMGSPRSSRFGGQAWQAETSQWPECQECKRPMSFLLQIASPELPSELKERFGQGLIQVFHCDTDCDTFEPFLGSHARIESLVAAGALASPGGEVRVFEAKQIVSWTPFADLPHFEDHHEADFEFDYDDETQELTITCEKMGLEINNFKIDEDEMESVLECKDGDKLAGWPSWVQGNEIPNCPKCRKAMDLVFQIDSEQNLAIMFGDMGIAHLTQCPDHKDVFAFAWACS